MDIRTLAEQIGGLLIPAGRQTKDTVQETALGDLQQQEWSDGTLYFFSSSQLAALKIFPSCILLSGGLPDEYAGKFHCISVPEEDAVYAFNRATRLLKEENPHSWVETLYEFADSSRQLEDVIDRSSMALDASLVAFDANFFIWSYSRSIPVVDPVWKTVVAEGYGSYSFVKEVRELFEHDEVDTLVQEVTCDLSPYRKFRRHLFHRGRWIGTVLMICSRTPVDTEKLRLFDEICGLIYYTIQKYAPNLLREDSAYSKLLYHLLIGASGEDLETQIAGMQFPARASVLAIRPDRNMGEDWAGSELIPSILKIDPGAKWTWFHEGLVVLVSMDITWELIQQRVMNFRLLAREKGLRIGTSLPFQNILHFRRCYDMACEALEMAEIYAPESRFNEYLDYQFFSLLKSTSRDTDLHKFTHPALAILRQYDYENHSELYHTLRVFVEQNCRPGQTAEALYIHRNTLTKRLERIHELCLLDLEDAKTIFSLSLSYGIERYLLQGK